MITVTIGNRVITVKPDGEHFDVTSFDFRTAIISHGNREFSWDLCSGDTDEASEFICKQSADPQSELNKAVSAFLGAPVHYYY